MLRSCASFATSTSSTACSTAASSPRAAMKRNNVHSVSDDTLMNQLGMVTKMTISRPCSCSSRTPAAPPWTRFLAEHRHDLGRAPRSTCAPWSARRAQSLISEVGHPRHRPLHLPPPPAPSPPRRGDLGRSGGGPLHHLGPNTHRQHRACPTVRTEPRSDGAVPNPPVDRLGSCARPASRGPRGRAPIARAGRYSTGCHRAV